MSDLKITVEKRPGGKYDKLRIFDYGDHKVGEWQPGNATRYVCYVQKNKDIGEPGCWAVSFPEWGCCYFIAEGGYLDLSYMAEKFSMQRTGRRLNHVDLSEMAKLICRLVPGTRCDMTVTDDTGHETEAYQAKRLALTSEEA